jgi:hypothetical protein
VKPFITYKKQILPVIFSLLILTSSVSIYAFGLQEGGAIVPTEDVEASKFMSNYDGGYKLIYKTGTIIIFYNLTSKSTVSGWKYWEEKQLPPDEREYITKPNVKYVILTKKLKDTNLDYDLIQKNLNNDTAMNRFYDNGFIQIYS